MVDGDLMQLVPALVEIPVQPLILDHELLHFLLPLTHLIEVDIQLLSEMGLAFVLVLDDMPVL